MGDKSQIVIRQQTKLNLLQVKTKVFEKEKKYLRSYDDIIGYLITMVMDKWNKDGMEKGKKTRSKNPASMERK